MKDVLKDLLGGFKLFYIWKNLAWFDVLQRYKRTKIGPFWGVITTGVIIVFTGPVYSKLFNQNLHEYFPYVAVSYFFWSFLSVLIQELSNSLISSSEYIKHVSWPYSVYFYRCIIRNLIVLSHNSIVILPVLFYFSTISFGGLGLFFFGLFIVIFMALGFGMLTSTLSLHYRDIPQLISNFLNMLFFITPVFWSAKMLGEHTWIASINPMFHVLEILRQPLLGNNASSISYAITIIMGLFFFVFGLAIFKSNYKKIAFWT